MQIIWNVFRRWFGAPTRPSRSSELPPMSLRDWADLPPSHPVCDCDSL